MTKKRKWGFPYLGYGYAWENVMQGTIGGNSVSLEARNIETQRKWGFPYFGYGFAWAQTMSGNCGDSLDLELNTNEVRKKRIFGFPYRGYGFAWINRSTLTLLLKD